MRSTTANPSLFQGVGNEMENAIQQVLLSQVNTILPGIVEVVNDDGTYDVQPTLNYLLRNQPPVKPALMINLPQAKIIFGNAEIKGRYKVGDAVLVGICQRDITVLKKNWKTQTNPNSLRRFALPDGIILNGLSNSEPTTVIEIKDGEVNITATTIKLNGSVIINDVPYVQHKHSPGTFAAGGDPVTGTSGGVS